MTHQLVPRLRRLDVLDATDPDFLVIPHGKFGARQPFASGLFGKGKRQILVLVECAFRTTQEPLAERHVGFDFALLAREGIVLHAQQCVEREGRERKFVGVSELVLGGREMEERGALEVETRFLWGR